MRYIFTYSKIQCKIQDKSVSYCSKKSCSFYLECFPLGYRNMHACNKQNNIEYQKRIHENVLRLKAKRKSLEKMKVKA
jgi:hypothetical protein